MTALHLSEIRALEILDSRGRPTVAVHARSSQGAIGTATVPSGASTGSGEAVEVRDGDPKRYGGLGVQRAVEAVNGEIAELLLSRPWTNLTQVDHALIELDGTPNKFRLGANALLGVSIAIARCLAAEAQTPLWSWFATVTDQNARMPIPHFNVLNGGAHTSTALDFQEFMIAPLGAPNLTEAVRAGAEVYTVLRALLLKRGYEVGLGDEGGFAPAISQPEEALGLLTEAIDAAGYHPGRDGIAIALDPAASEFRGNDGTYSISGKSLTSDDLIDRYVSLVEAYPIWSIEDGLGEDDEPGWKTFTERLGDRIQIVGDDIFVTDPKRIEEAAQRRVANAVLIKPNQIGTLTECLDAMATCRRLGYAHMVSHRSGDTSDDLIADLAVGTGSGQIKAGAPARGERVAKYNRLLDIEATAGSLGYGLERGTGTTQ